MKIQVSLSSKYLPTWDTFCGVREFVQNWLDGKDMGYDGEISHNTKTNTLTLSNKDFIITKAQLGILGESGKRNNAEVRGFHGEGIKVGSLVLLRDGRSVCIYSGEFKYTGSIEHSSEFDAEVLTWAVRHLHKTRTEGFTVEIGGISAQKWEEYKEAFLCFRSNKESIRKCGSYGEILLDSRDAGKLYVKDIFVNKDAGVVYGYNFKDASLDRDRRMVSSYDIESKASGMTAASLESGAISGKEYLYLLKKNARDVKHGRFYVKKEVASKVVSEFHLEFGENSTPVGTIEEVGNLEHYGVKGVISSPAMIEFFDAFECGYKQVMALKQQEVKIRYEFLQLDCEARKNIEEIFSLLESADVKFNRTLISFVDFHSDSLLGIYNKGQISIAVKSCYDKKELLKVMVEELAHEFGDDGSFNHKHAIHDIYTKIVEHLSKVSA